MPNPDMQALAVALNSRKMQAPQGNMPVQQRVQMLNMGQMQPQQGDGFAYDRAQALQAEQAREAQMMQARMQQEAMEVPQVTPPVQQPSFAEAVMSPEFLRRKSMESPRGQMRQADKLSEDIQLAAELNRLDNSEMPAEIGSPGYKGRAFDAFQYLIGRKRAM